MNARPLPSQSDADTPYRMLLERLVRERPAEGYRFSIDLPLWAQDRKALSACLDAQFDQIYADAMLKLAQHKSTLVAAGNLGVIARRDEYGEMFDRALNAATMAQLLSDVKDACARGVDWTLAADARDLPSHLQELH